MTRVFAEAGDLYAVRTGMALFAQSRNKVWWNLSIEPSSDGIYTERIEQGKPLVFLGKDMRGTWTFLLPRMGRLLQASSMLDDHLRLVSTVGSQIKPDGVA